MRNTVTDYKQPSS